MALANITNNILTDTGVNVSSLTPTSTTISTTAPLQGGGDLSANRTLSITQSGTSANGFLSSTDWNTFNNKQAAGNYMTSLTGEATGTGPGATAVTLNNASVTAKVLTGVNITGGTVVATDSILTAFGKLQNQINGLIGSSIYQGVWNAATNTPALASGVGVRGYYYIVNVAGTTNLDGITDWFVGDWAIFDGTAWQQVDNTDAVVSVNGQTGAVSLTTDNIPEGATNQYYLNSRARAALSFAAGSGAYNSTTGVITIPTNTSQLTNGANFITLASLSGTAPIQYNSSTGAISITQAGTSSNGFLSSTDWNTFNNKQSALTNPVTGTGTTNYLPKFTGASTIGNSQIFDNGTNVGIGTASPSVKLQVVGDGSFSGFVNANVYNLAGLTGGGALSWTTNTLRLGQDSYFQTLQFWTNGSTRMTLDASGNLGLGVTPSAWSGVTTLQIGNSSLGDASTNLQLTHNAYYDGGNWRYITSAAASNYYQAGGFHFWRTAPSGTAGNAISFTQAMTLNASGNLSIGNTNDTYKLDVSGTARFTNSVTFAGSVYNFVGSNRFFASASGSINYLYTGATNLTILNQGDTATLFTLANSGAATFTSSVSGSLIRANDGVFQLFRASAFRGGLYTFDAAIGSGTDYSSTLTSETDINFLTGGSITKKVTFLANGNVGIGTTNPDSLLSVNGGMSIFGVPIVKGNGTSSNGRIEFYSDSTPTYAASIGTTTAGIAGVPDGSLRFALYNGTWSERMRITSAGNVLIGTTSDAGYRLDVNGTGRFSGSLTIGPSSPLKFKYSDNYDYFGIGYISGADYGFYNYNYGRTDLIFTQNTGAATFSANVSAPIFTSSGGRGTSYGFRLPDWQIYNTSSGNGLAFNNYSTDCLYITSGGNIGIGTSTISNTAGFSRQVQIEGTYPALTLKNVTGVAGWYSLGAGSNGDFGIWNNTTSSYPIYINSSNNVGISNSSQNAVLDIGAGNSNTWVKISSLKEGGASSTYGLSLTETHRSSYVNGVNHYGIYATPAFNTSSSNLGTVYGAFIQPTENGTYNIDYGYGLYVQAITVNSGTISNNYAAVFMGGNVGIGTITPLDLLHINGSGIIKMRITGSVESQLRLDSTYGQISNVSGDLYYTIESASGSQIFRTGSSTERMRITSGGAVCIGTTSPYGSNLLSVNGSIYSTGNIAAVVAADVDLFTFISTSASYTKSCFVGSIAAAGSTSSYYFYGQQSTSVVSLKIFTNGNIQNTNNSYGAISDARLKENIIDATPKLEDLMKVKVRNYNLKGESNKQLGVISQELEEIFPNMIEESTNIGESMKIKGVKYSVFVPMLIKAVQEQQAQINELKLQLNK
jgi:hypothetical protein